MKLATLPKTILLSCLSVGCLVLTPFFDLSAAPDKTTGNGGVKKIVIDAGHGGKDPGCHGNMTVEKQVALEICLKLGDLISKQYPDVEVIYTRKTDVFIPLDERAKIANKADADLFISIHCNTVSRRNQAEGSETYVMGLHRAKENLDVAKRENSAILMEDNYIQRYDGYDPDSPEGHIILSMYQNAYLEQSILFADCVERQFSQGLARKSRGVKQAGFLVLRTTTMPSVLIEAGFLSHDDDEQFLSVEANLDKMAGAIFQAFAEYKAQVEGYLPDNGSIASEPLLVSTQPNPHTTTTESAQGGSAQPKVTTGAPPSAGEKSGVPNPQAGAAANTSGMRGVAFYVQLAASKTALPKAAQTWKVPGEIVIHQEDGYYKYLAGPFKELEQASAANKDLRAICCKDAFVVAYRDEKRIPVKEAEAVPRS